MTIDTGFIIELPADSIWSVRPVLRTLRGRVSRQCRLLGATRKTVSIRVPLSAAYGPLELMELLQDAHQS